MRKTTKKTIIRAVSLFLAILMAAGVLLSLTGCSSVVKEEADAYGLDSRGYYHDVKASDFVSLPEDIKSIKVEESALAVDDAYIDYLMDNLLVSNGTKVPQEGRKAELDDWVTIDYTGSVDGMKFTGGSGTDVDVKLGSGKFIAGFEEQIVGHKAGDVFDITVTFPDGYGETTDSEGNTVVLSNAEATFEINLKSVFFYELNDEDVAAAFTDTTMEDGSAIDSYEKAREYYTEAEKAYLLQSAVSMYINENTSVETMPEGITELYMNLERLYIEKAAEADGCASADDYLTDYGYEGIEAYMEQNAAYFEESVKYVLTMQAIAETIGYVPTEEDVREFHGDDYEDCLEKYGYNVMAMNTMIVNVRDILCDNAVVVPASEAEAETGSSSVAASSVDAVAG